MNIRDLLDSTDIEPIENVIKLHYGDQELPKYEALYTKLKQMQPASILTHTLWEITAYSFGDNE